ncbi:hypothetical protein [Corallococcus sp. EGB]|uniref:hypothetical protein n=1 Tax=Corallococcus sp. EGB TaxID=1521117 RepID=UPI001CBAF8F4|nr:hypothetical protein [Corallococcus sp. EGB]
MNRLLALVVPLALLMGTGCVVEAHSHRPVRRVAYVEPAPVVQYRFAGAHPVPDDYGGGWCPEDYAHVHDYQPPQASYVYTDDVYYYRGPTVVWYWDYHPTPSGGYCNLHGRHQHDFYPHGSWGAGYSYDRGSRGYRWSNSHQASAIPGRNNVAPSRPAPAPGPVYQGRNPPPGGTGTGARPPSGSGWGRNNVAPSSNGRDNRDDDRDNDRGNGGGWNTPASKSRDDDRDNNRGNDRGSDRGNSGRSSGGWDSGSSGGRGSSGSSSGSSGSSGRGSSGGNGSSGSSGGGWNTGRSSGSSSGSGRSGSGW